MDGSGNNEGVQSLDDIVHWIWMSPHLLHFRSTQRVTFIVLRVLPRFPLLFIEKGMRQELAFLSICTLRLDGERARP